MQRKEYAGEVFDKMSKRSSERERESKRDREVKSEIEKVILRS